MNYQECTHCGNQVPCEQNGVPIVRLSAERPVVVVREMRKDECRKFEWERGN